MGALCGLVALATPPFPPPPPWRLPAKHRVPLRAVHPHTAEDIHRGAPTLFSGMLAQVPVGTRVRSHGSASPLRRGAAARQFPPSLCRCARQPLSRHSSTLGGLRAPHPPRGPQAPFVGPPGHYQSVMEAPPPNLRCSPAQGLGVAILKGIPSSRPTSMGRLARGAGRGFPYPKNRLHPMGAPPHRPSFRMC